MGRNDKREEKKGKLFSKRDIVIIVITLLASIVLIFFIAGAVKINEGKEWISLEGWLSYYGSIGGAMFGGYITAIGLYITFRINNKQLEEQRKIDNERWENSNRQFNQQMKIQIINEKINDYKRCNEEIANLIYYSSELRDEMSKYKSELLRFQVNIYTIQNPKLGPTPEPVKFKIQLEIIIDQYIELKKLVERVKISSKCIYGESIYNDIEESMEIWEDVQDAYIGIYGCLCLGDITDNYSDYINKDGMIIRELTEFEQLEKMMDEFIDKLLNMSDKFYDCYEEIPKLICKLYEEKYAIDDICDINNEQKLSNNI